MVVFKECELDGRMIKYEDDKVWLWKETRGNEMLKNPRWVVPKPYVRNTGYTIITINGRGWLYHRVIYYIHNPEWNIYDVSCNNQIDHIDRDKTNNNISNLRVVTAGENQWNRNGKGYTWSKLHSKWLAQIQTHHKHMYLGLFDTKEEASTAYINAKKIWHVKEH
jgi:hypothetical protein